MMNRFKRKALRVIADFLSNEEVEDIKELFKKMDTDNDGIVSIEELKAGFRKFDSQLAESEIQMFIEAVDNNGSKGTLDYGEFVAISLHLKRMANDEHLHKAFSYFDKDGNGFIEPDELRTALMEDGTDDCTDVANDIFQEVDTDKDGRISYDEFVSMMKTGTDWRKASRHYSRGRFNSLSLKLMKDGSFSPGVVRVMKEEVRRNIHALYYLCKTWCLGANGVTCMIPLILTSRLLFWFENVESKLFSAVRMFIEV
ncbi:hypothetical protein TSUD_161270 [Trifolium subterraneum]|uniref:EF-hand domain-containing protein n=1 Tax=Trifolium subterraneum TaxID=3900 RepID=A0A2Z6M5T4_TRISU|nr:hypothetical protein TSUD_161270 [Trifolium subterraneum]